MGGSAIKAYRGSRTIEDIDIIIEISSADGFSELRQKLTEFNSCFNGKRIELYCVSVRISRLLTYHRLYPICRLYDGRALVRTSPITEDYTS